jgi:hypothetical protein
MTVVNRHPTHCGDSRVPKGTTMTTTTTDHTIETIDPLPTDRRKSGASWHQVTCSCGWTRKYVSHYRAIVMHDKHTRESLS